MLTTKFIFFVWVCERNYNNLYGGACTKTRNGETKPTKRNDRNHRNETTETAKTTETTKTKQAQAKPPKQPKQHCRNEQNHQNETAETPIARKFPNRELGDTAKLCCYRFGECGDLKMA